MKKNKTQRTVKVALKPTEEQKKVLFDTLVSYAGVFCYVCRYGFDNKVVNKVDIHRATYYAIQSLYPTIPTGLIQTARDKAVEALKAVKTVTEKGKKASCPSSNALTARYDVRTATVSVEDQVVSLSSVAGRLRVPFTISNHAWGWFNIMTSVASADLMYRKGNFSLNIVLNVASVPFKSNDTCVGVDVGITRPAVTSEALFLGDRRWKDTNLKRKRLVRKLKSKGTRSARRHLKRIGNRANRFRTDCDHVLSKRIVASVPAGTTIALEDLTDIRDSAPKKAKGSKKPKGRRFNEKIHSWSFERLQTFVEYKAADAGCAVIYVDPRNTSRTCPNCGHVSKANRRKQSVFKCVQCGYELNADLAGAREIARRGRDGMLSLSGCTVNQPIVTTEVQDSSVLMTSVTSPGF